MSLLLVLAALPILALLWLTFRAGSLTVAGVAGNVRVRTSRRLLDDPVCCLRGLLLTELVALSDDVLVGYRDGYGSWFTVDPDDTTVVIVTPDVSDAEGQLLLARAMRDPRAMKLLRRWHANQTRLIGVVTREPGVLGIVDDRRRNAVIAEPPFRP